MILLTEFTIVPETTLIEGIVVSVVGYLIVFTALVILYYFFDIFVKVINLRTKIYLEDKVN
jgi:Na+-transporting methylmalonyl-CoA/oxaloacetate decarboxylase gamma subunit